MAAIVRAETIILQVPEVYMDTLPKGRRYPRRKASMVCIDTKARGVSWSEERLAEHYREEERHFRIRLKGLEATVSRYSDKVHAKRYFRAVFEGLRPSPWYVDDPIGDPESLYLKRFSKVAKVAMDIIRGSRDRKLFDEAAQFLIGLVLEMPKTAKWLGVKIEAAPTAPPPSAFSSINGDPANDMMNVVVPGVLGLVLAAIGVVAVSFVVEGVRPRPAAPRQLRWAPDIPVQ